MGQHLISPIIIIGYIGILFILIYLYKNSEFMNKKRFIYSTLVLTLVLAVIFIIWRPRNPHSIPKLKVAFFPLIAKDQTVANSYLLSTIPEMIAKSVSYSTKNRAVIAPVRWTQYVINMDSIRYENYLSKLVSKIQFQYYVTGTIAVKDNVYHLQTQLHGPTAVFSDTSSFSKEQIVEVVHHLSQQICKHVSLPDSNLFKLSSITDATDIYLQGYDAFLNRDYSKSLENAMQAMKLDSVFADAYYLAGYSSFSQGLALRKLKKNSESDTEIEKAKKFLTTACTLDSTNDEYYRLAGECNVYSERWSQAEWMLDKAIKLNYANADIYVPLSRLHRDRFKKHGFSTEEQLFRYSLLINPCYEQGILVLSDYYLFKNYRDQAIQVLKQFLNINPNSVPALMMLGKIYILRNEFIPITDVLNKIIALDPNNSDAYYNLGILYYNLKDNENAKRFFDRAIEIDNHLNSYLYLAKIYEMSGQKDKAIECLRFRIRNKTGPDDEFYEEARKHLFKLMHPAEKDTLPGK
jgi:TPR repeat protein